jgi:hypothetical protein
MDRNQRAKVTPPLSTFPKGDVAMPTFIMLTRLNPEAVRSPGSLNEKL